MIAAQTVVEAGIDVPSSSSLHPKVHVHKGECGTMKIGERNIIEELCDVSGSTLGNGNLIEVGTVIRNVSTHDIVSLMA